MQKDYEKYEPPYNPLFDITDPRDGRELDFDESLKVKLSFKEGLSKTTFVMDENIQDVGYIAHSKKEGIFLSIFDTVYVEFEDSVQVGEGDLFSIYSDEGEVKHLVSDRKGRRYDILGQIKVKHSREDLWECEILSTNGMVKRDDRLTVYTPRVSKVLRTFNSRKIEAAIVGFEQRNYQVVSLGSLVYLDRGRADGVEIGNIFDLYSFIDQQTGKKITFNPTYKIGEVSIIRLSENFSTALVVNLSGEVLLGTVALSKTQEEAAQEMKSQRIKKFGKLNTLKEENLDNLDVEFNLDDLSDDFLNNIQDNKLMGIDLEEFERQEKENSVITDHEEDLRALEQLEQELLGAEEKLNEQKIDEDKSLEQLDLDDFEKTVKQPDPNAFGAMEDLEKEIGQKYMDEDINAKDNPYGLTEFDLEEIDELLNSESL